MKVILLIVLLLALFFGAEAFRVKGKGTTFKGVMQGLADLGNAIG
jgi:hypothetical protein